MILFAVLAILTALTVAWCAHPLMKTGEKRMQRAGWLMIGIIGGMSLTLYLLLGNPGIKSSPALFDTTGPQAQIRALTGEELLYMQALAETPEDITLYIRLGNVRIRAGRPQDAIPILKRALKKEPEHIDIKEELGAAHYTAALALLTATMPPDLENAQHHLRQALHYAPADAPYRQELKTLAEQIEKEGKKTTTAPTESE